MIKEINDTCEKLNKKLRISVPLPSPGKKTLRAASVCHFALGAGLVAAGVLLPSKRCAALGGIGLLSSIALGRESGLGKKER